MKPQDIEIIQSVLEITGPISPTEVYDKPKSFLKKARLQKCLIMGATHHTRVLAPLFIQP
ncbi:hypothetical protein F7189_05645 [Helicobacter pylori]|nr:hypothetical protein [Helicobacter pylori]